MVKLISLSIFIIWLSAVVAFFWWQDGQYRQAFEPLLVEFDQSALNVSHTPEYSNYLVVNYIEPECPCSKFAYPHINNLKQKFNNTMFVDGDVSTVPVTPSVAIYNAQKKMVYYGPYSAGAVCGAGSDFVSTIISGANKFEAQNPVQYAVGCYCKRKNEVL